MELAIVTLENRDMALSLHVQDGDQFTIVMHLPHNEHTWKALKLDLQEKGYTFIGTLHFGIGAGIDQWIYSKASVTAGT